MEWLDSLNMVIGCFILLHCYYTTPMSPMMLINNFFFYRQQSQPHRYLCHWFWGNGWAERRQHCQRQVCMREPHLRWLSCPCHVLSFSTLGHVFLLVAAQQTRNFGQLSYKKTYLGTTSMCCSPRSSLSECVCSFLSDRSTLPSSGTSCPHSHTICWKCPSIVWKQIFIHPHFLGMLLSTL